MLSFSKNIPVKHNYFYDKTVLFLQIFATCFEQQGHHQTKLLQKYIKESATNIEKGLSLYIFGRALPDDGFIGRKCCELKKKDVFLINVIVFGLFLE